MSIIKQKIIACQVFTDELPAVLPEEYGDIDITWLDAGLHMDLDKLEIALKQALKDAETEGRMQDFFLAAAATRICAISSTVMAGKFSGPKTVSKLSAMKVLMNWGKITQWS